MEKQIQLYFRANRVSLPAFFSSSQTALSWPQTSTAKIDTPLATGCWLLMMTRSRNVEAAVSCRRWSISRATRRLPGTCGSPQRMWWRASGGEEKNMQFHSDEPLRSNLSKIPVGLKGRQISDSKLSNKTLSSDFRNMWPSFCRSLERVGHLINILVFI